MFFTTKRKLMADNEMLRVKSRKLEQDLGNARGIIAQQQRLMKRQSREIEALEQTIDGMEKDLNNKKKYIKGSDQARKQLSQRERETRVKYEKLAEDMRRIERDGLCCLCVVGESPSVCGCTCCFKYAGELPDVRDGRPSGQEEQSRYVKVLGELTMDDMRKECKMRNKNGNCSVIGGFCTDVNDPICVGLHNAYEFGCFNTALRLRQEPSQNVKV